MSSSISPSYSSPGEAVASIDVTRNLIMSFAQNPTLSTCSTVNTIFQGTVRYEFREREKLQEIQEKREEKERVLKEKIRILEALRAVAEENQFELPPLDGDIDTQYATALTFLRAQRAQLLGLNIFDTFVNINFIDGINVFLEPGFNFNPIIKNGLFDIARAYQNLDIINRLLEQPEFLAGTTINNALVAVLNRLNEPKNMEILLSMILSCGDRFTREQFHNILFHCAEYNEIRIIRIIRILLFGLTKERILSEDRNQNSILTDIAARAARNGSIDVFRAVFKLEDRMPNDPDYYQTAYVEAIKAGFSEGVALLTPHLKGRDYRKLLMSELSENAAAGNLETTQNLLNHIKKFKNTEAGDLLYAAAKSGNTEVLQEIISRFKDQISQEWVKVTIKDRMLGASLPILRMLLSLLQRLDPDEDDMFASIALCNAFERNDNHDESVNMLLRVGRNVYTVEFLKNIRDRLISLQVTEKVKLSFIIDHLSERQNAYLQELYDEALERGDDKMAHELMLEYRDHNY